MADNLPLIPSKRGGCAGDVRPVLRAVFRERVARLPPLPAPPSAACCPYACARDEPTELLQNETELRAQRARRLARATPPNRYTLRKPLTTSPPPDRRTLLQRADLMPRIDQNATRNTSLWIKNILTRSSGDVSAFEVIGSPFWPPASISEWRSAQSLSFGEVIVREPLPPTPLPPPSPLAELVVCVPTSVHFVNFTPGQLHTRSLRLVNMSRVEVQLSVRPLARHELDVQLCGRLKVTSGSATEMNVLFRPLDVRSVYDELLVRVSGGRALTIPISCYIQPPILDVLMPSSALSMLSCPVEVEGAYEPLEPNLGDGQPADAGAITDSTVEAGVEAGAVAGATLLDLGARLLGDVNRSSLVLRCSQDHVSFFLLTEDAWLSHDLEELSHAGAVVAGPFVVSPVWWRGGGEARGAAWCRAALPGLHTAALRLVCTTAVTRPIHLLADALFFYPEHVTLKAQEKTYDICSADDPDCEYYVHLGTTFPHHGLAASVSILNNSPVTYGYYWSVREWGSCSCWSEELAARAGAGLGAEDDPERLCPGARAARDAQAEGGAGGISGEAADAVVALRVEPAQGAVAPRSSAPVRVSVPDVGARVGTQRAVLILVLKNIPQKSFPQGFYPMVVTTSTVKTEHIPGVQREDRVLCDVVCCQLEVWWHVAPLQFVLDPPLLILPYSRRVHSVELQVRATQLTAGGVARAGWRTSPPRAELPPAVHLHMTHPQLISLRLPLTELPNHFPATETIMLEEERGRWASRAAVTRRCATRHPALQPATTWLGVVPPANNMRAQIHLINDTHQDIYWWGDVFRWLQERWPKAVCVSRPQPCKACLERTCTCRLLRPTRGFAPRRLRTPLEYAVVAPDEDGCVATLVRVRRTEPGTGQLPREAPVDGRAVLLSYRVLAPRLTLTVSPCGGESHECDIGCGLEECAGAILRPARALTAGLRTCYRLHFTNHTPLKTRVKWEPPPDSETLLRVIFIPEEFDMNGYEETDIRVVLEARQVCARRVCARRASVLHAHEPLYLVIDAGISGLEVDYWLPLPNYSFFLRRKQREMFPWSKPLPTTVQEAFAWEDEKRAVIGENVCRCKSQMRWLPPPPEPPLPPGVATPPVQVVSTPPPLTRTCACFSCARPLRPAPEPLALEVRELPLRTVHTLRIRMRSACPLAARWCACVRLGVRTAPRTLVTGDVWSGLVRACGVAARVTPARGVLGARAVQDLELRVYADSWGLYRDQLLILVEGLEPLVLNVWVHAVGCPLQFALRPGTGAEHYSDNPPVLWVSEPDPERVVRARNASRAPLLVHPYMLRDHERIQDALPFRLCIRLFDVPPPVCPCLYSYQQSMASVQGEGEESAPAPDALETASVSTQSMDTGVEVYLAHDYGIQDCSYFKVEPWEQEVPAGGVVEWRVSALPRAPPAPLEPPAPLTPPAHTLLLRIQPLEPRGPWWMREEPAAAAVRVRSMARAGALQFSHETVCAHLCALILPDKEVMRMRKRLYVQNVGDGRLIISMRVENVPINAFESSAPNNSLDLGESTAEDSLRKQAGTKKPGGLVSRGNVSRADDLLFKVASSPPAKLPEGTGPEWSVVRGERHGTCAGACGPREHVQRQQQVELTLPAHSTTEVCVELCVRSSDVWPAAWEGVRGAQERDKAEEESLPPVYEQKRTFTSQLQFYDDDNLVQCVLLVLELEVPRLRAHPVTLELGYVCDGDTRKTYFSLWHTSKTETISVYIRWLGDAQFRMSPSHVLLPPAAERNVYVIYTGRFTGAVAEGWAEARAAGAAGAWCCAAVRVRARTSRDYKCHLPSHDHTDEPSLLPPDLDPECALP